MSFSNGFFSHDSVTITSPELLGLLEWVTSCQYKKIVYHYIEDYQEEYYF
jgi:hypothetical protein